MRMREDSPAGRSAFPARGKQRSRRSAVVQAARPFRVRCKGVRR